MFTIDQIKAAHSRVKSGADFPSYIQEIKKLGIVKYETFVSTGNTYYYGTNEYTISTGAKNEALTIVESSNIAQFNIDLKAHQQGKTDFPTFCKDCAKSGVEKWVTNTDKMTCTYYDMKGTEMLMEIIPH